MLSLQKKDILLIFQTITLSKLSHYKRTLKIIVFFCYTFLLSGNIVRATEPYCSNISFETGTLRTGPDIPGTTAPSLK